MHRRSTPPRAYRDTVARPRRTSGYGSLSGPRPDRVAAWAVVLGIFLILVATATSEGSPDQGAAPRTGGASLPEPETDQARELERVRAKLGLAAQAGSAPAARSAAIRRMPIRRASWYGPGLYGRTTACGQRLRPGTIGVAHRRLPCGTPVTFYYRGKFETVPVIDRGPFRAGISFDLTAAAAKRLGLETTARVRAVH